MRGNDHRAGHRDPRRVTHPACPGLPDAGLLRSRPHAVVIGAGIAGLAAATGLAERGVSVDVVERESYLGGRVGGWTEPGPDGQPLAMNRGFHAFFRQYYNLRDLLRRSDSGLLTPVDDYPLIDASGRCDTFRGLPRTPPWNAVMFALRSPTFRLRDLASLNARAAAPLAAVSVPEIYDLLDDVDAETFLHDINFPEAARHLAFEVFSRSFFAEPRRLSAAELATMFHIYFLGSSEGLVFDVACANFDTLWEPLRAYLSRRGVRFHSDMSVSAIETVSGGVFRAFRAFRAFRVHHSGGSLDADAVVLAADIAGLRRIVEASADLGDPAWRSSVASLRAAPAFVVQRLWLDRPVAPDRPAFLGAGGLEPLDNVSVLDRYEREAIDWARRHGGSVVELHSYAVADGSGVADRLRARLHEVYPETRDARVIAERILCRQDCPRFAPGDHARRPGVVTPHPGLMLAGDGIRIDLPVALMERAATTGWSAANRLLRGWCLTGHPMHTVPTRGRNALLRRVATSGRGSLS